MVNAVSQICRDPPVRWCTGWVPTGVACVLLTRRGPVRVTPFFPSSSRPFFRPFFFGHLGYRAGYDVTRGGVITYTAVRVRAHAWHSCVRATTNNFPRFGIFDDRGTVNGKSFFTKEVPSRIVAFSDPNAPLHFVASSLSFLGVHRFDKEFLFEDEQGMRSQASNSLTSSGRLIKANTTDERNRKGGAKPG